jgi:hypothetical protein
MSLVKCVEQRRRVADEINTLQAAAQVSGLRRQVGRCGWIQAGTLLILYNASLRRIRHLYLKPDRHQPRKGKSNS